MHDGFFGVYDTDGTVKLGVRLGGSDEDWAVGVAARRYVIERTGKLEAERSRHLKSLRR